jgi:hypothetical protein
LPVAAHGNRTSKKIDVARETVELGARKWNLSVLVPVACLSLSPREGAHMIKIAFALAAAGAVFMTAPLLVGTGPAKAQDLKMAQGVDIQIGRDRYDRYDRDRDYRVGVGPGGVSIGPRHRCRMVTTTIERGNRTITRRERRCD